MKSRGLKKHQGQIAVIELEQILRCNAVELGNEKRKEILAPVPVKRRIGFLGKLTLVSGRNREKLFTGQSAARVKSKPAEFLSLDLDRRS